MDVEFFREICLALPQTNEELPFDEVTLCFKVGGKIFAILPLDDGDRANLKCDPERVEELRAAYNGIIPGYHMNKQHWNTVLFYEDIPDHLIRELIQHSYELIVSKLSRKTRQELGL
jgi:predicted DNA-binding protein (MmcQ/YjbR family)